MTDSGSAEVSIILLHENVSVHLPTFHKCTELLETSYFSMNFFKCAFQYLKFKTQLTISFFTAVNHNYGDNQQTLKTETKKMDQQLPITADRCDLLTQLK